MTHSLWLLDSYLGVAAATGLVLAAMVSERDEAQAAATALNRDLDATVRARTAELQRDRARLMQAQRVAALGSWECDLSTGEMTWSEELRRLYGLAPADGDSFEEFREMVPPADRARFDEAIAQAVAGGGAFELDHRVVVLGAERHFHATGKVHPGREGSAARITGTAQDVTDRRHAEMKFQSLLEAAPDAIVVVDRDGVIRLVNRQTEILFGYGRDELLGGRVETLLPRPARHRHPQFRAEFFAHPTTRPMGAGIELTACRRDGSEFPVDISLAPLETGDGLLVSAAIRDVTDRKLAQEQLAHQALHDPLTGLPNRTLLEDRLAQALARARRTASTVAVLFIDLDRFKVINDSRGHSVGDRLLQVVADRLRSTVRPGDTVARFGGDEFVVIVADPPAVIDAARFADRVLTALAEPVDLGPDDVTVTVSASIGVTLAGPEDDPESLLRDADAAMYRAKERGRGRVEQFDEKLRSRAVNRLEIEHALRLGLERDEFDVEFQPVISLATGETVGVEALVRWWHPEWGRLLPGLFISVAEETGLIVGIGELVMRRSCARLRAWLDEFGPAAPSWVAVNLSGRQLLERSLVPAVRAALSEAGIPPEMLHLEITESVLMDDVSTVLPALRALKDLGVRLAIDDFGTGYSSLTYLKQFPLDSLKIDRSFVDGLGVDAHDTSIVTAVTSMAHALGLRTIAEGVETVGQLDELRRLGCDLAQGFHLSMPLRDSEMHHYLADRVGAGPSSAHGVPGTTEPRAG